MKLVRTIVSVGLVFAGGLIGYSWLADIGHADVYAYHDYTTPVDRLHPPLKPGDMIALRDDGEVMPKVCTLDAGSVTVTEGRTRGEVYYNKLHENLAGYLHVIGETVDFWKTDAAEVQTAMPASWQPRELAFTGARQHLPDLATPRKMKQADCDLRVAMHIADGMRVCTVRKTMNEMRLADNGSIREETVAIALRQYGVYRSPEQFEAIGVDYTQAAEKASGAACDTRHLPIDAKLRDLVRAIEIRN